MWLTSSTSSGLKTCGGKFGGANGDIDGGGGDGGGHSSCANGFQRSHRRCMALSLMPSEEMSPFRAEATDASRGGAHVQCLAWLTLLALLGVDMEFVSRNPLRQLRAAAEPLWGGSGRCFGESLSNLELRAWRRSSGAVAPHVATREPRAARTARCTGLLVARGRGLGLAVPLGLPHTAWAMMRGRLQVRAPRCRVAKVAQSQ